MILIFTNYLLILIIYSLYYLYNLLLLLITPFKVGDQLLLISPSNAGGRRITPGG